MKKHLYIVLLITFSLLTVRPLFNTGLFPIHDDTQPARIVEMGKALIELHLPARWSPDLGYGYGYPLFNFYAPLPYYLGGLLLVLTNNIIFATKGMFLIGTLIASITMYILVQELFDKESALLAGILYSFAPYHAAQIYIRGSVGEYFAYGLIPLCVWSLYKSYDAKSPKLALICGLPLALLILSHNIIAMLFLGFIILLIIVLSFTGVIKHQGRINVLVSLISSLTLSAFFWLPALYETSYTAVTSITQGGSKYIDHFLFLDQLWDSPWGYAGSAPGRNDGMSFKVGKINVLLALIGTLLVFLESKKKTSPATIFGYSATILLVTSIYMTSQTSYPLWKLGDSILKYVQFPWRFLTFINFAAAFLASFAVYRISNKKMKILAVAVLIIMVAVLHTKYFNPQYYILNENSYYTSSSYLKWTASKISDEYLPQNFAEPQTENDLPTNLINNPQIQTHSIKESLKETNLTVTVSRNTELTFNKSYFPNWRLYVDNISTQLVNNKGLLSTNITEGTHRVELKLSSTFTEQIANILSIISVLTITTVLVFNNKRSTSENKRYG